MGIDNSEYQLYEIAHEEYLEIIIPKGEKSPRESIIEYQRDTYRE